MIRILSSLTHIYGMVLTWAERLYLIVHVPSFLTRICLSRRLFRVTLEISRAECNIDVTPGTLAATDTCIRYHVTRFEASRKVILHTRYISTCVGAGVGRGRGTKIKGKRIPFIFNDESTGSCMCLRLDLYLSHIKKYNRYAWQQYVWHVYV
jgi:hypothetical protein